MLLEVINAVKKDNKVVIKKQEDVSLLAQRGYGTATDGELNLTQCEALYLLGEKKISLLEESLGQAVEFQNLLATFRDSDPEIWSKYLIYRDLRSRGYVVREGFGFGLDFRVYERGEYGEGTSKFIVFGIIEGSLIPVDKLNEFLRYVQSLKKELILAVMDRRGEVVYYATSYFNLK
jgi:tRNA-intron endonuclease, archaea type